MEYPVRIADQLKSILKAYRTSQGLTQAELSQKMGVTQQAYSLLESAPERASFERILSVLSTLGVEVILREKQNSANQAPREW